MPADSPTLTPQQWQFLESLLRCGTIRAAAKKCGFSERTCREWRKLPAFKAVVDEINAERRNAVSLMVRGAAPKAVRTLVRKLKSKRDGDAIRAAQAILGHERTVVEQDDILGRLSALEGRK
jgi:phage terminase small subunit